MTLFIGDEKYEVEYDYYSPSEGEPEVVDIYEVLDGVRDVRTLLPASEIKIMESLIITRERKKLSL